MAKDFYATLGVSKTADDKAIKNAYRKLAREHHPDVNPNNPKAEARFKEISAAYDVLSDPEKRKMYDKFGDNYDKVPPGYEQYGGQGGGMPGGFGGGVNLEDIFAQAQRGGGANFQGGGQAGGIGDVFGQIFGGFGGQGKRRGPEKGGDVEQTVEISFEESIKGAQRTLNFIIRNDNGREDKRNVTVKIPALISDGATVKVSGKGALVQITGSSGLDKGDVQRLVEEAEANAAADAERREKAEAKNNLDQLVFQSQKFLAENGEKTGATEKEELQSALNDARSALEGDDTTRTNEALTRLTTAFQAAGASFYANAQNAEAGGAAEGGSADKANDGNTVEGEVVEGEVTETK